MNLLYDISVLGIGLIHPKARTGIFRVIENVAEQLALREDCDLTFCSHLNIVDSYRYLIDNKKLTHIPLSIPSNFLKDLYKYKRLELIQSLHLDVNQNLMRKLPIKANIRGLMLKESLANIYHIDIVKPKDLTSASYAIKSKDLERASIFHSPFYPIPPQVKKSKIKAVFLTSYDLIPILYPQYVEESVIELIKNVLKSITYDTWVLCISEATRNDLLNYMGDSIDPDKVRVTELAASNTFYHSSNTNANKVVREKYGIPDDPYILSLCTLEPRKNIDQAIRAFIKLVTQENIKDLNMVLVGTKGWMFEKIFNEIEASADIKERIIVTGYVPDEDLSPIYSDALLFVYPSFYEGFGLPPLEAMQCGTPVITSNTSSLPEVVGGAGIMVEPTDLDALCQAMLSIYNNPTLRENLVQKSLERAANFSWTRCVDETVDAYKASLNV